MQAANRHIQVVSATLSALIALVVATTGANAQSADVLAERLATLRSEVEGLSEQLAEAQSEARNDLQSRARQKSDLQMELDREEVRLAKLRSILDEKKKRIEESSERGDDLKPIFELALAGMRGYVAKNLPFRRVERLSELDKLEEQQRTGVLTYGKALVRLWSFVEDELRMSRESATFQQTIELEGEEKLVEVLRVGMVMLYFRTTDGTTGYARDSGGTWTFVRASGSEQSKQIATLFDSFKKQIRVGLFTLPNALPALQK